MLNCFRSDVKCPLHTSHTHTSHTHTRSTAHPRPSLPAIPSPTHRTHPQTHPLGLGRRRWCCLGHQGGVCRGQRGLVSDHPPIPPLHLRPGALWLKVAVLWLTVAVVHSGCGSQWRWRWQRRWRCWLVCHCVPCSCDYAMHAWSRDESFMSER